MSLSLWRLERLGKEPGEAAEEREVWAAWREASLLNKVMDIDFQNLDFHFAT